MKRICICLLLLLACLSAPAQHYDPAHRHSIELSSGIPPIHAFMLGGGSSYHQVMNGYRENTILRPSLNLGYTFTISERWDFNFLVNAVAQFYKVNYYPQSGEVEEADGYVRREYDTKADPVRTESGSRWWVSYIADFRWKWYRTDAVRLYTAFGIGYVPGLHPFIPIAIHPYITPVGINFGRNHFYGVAELNASPAATLVLLGAGYRF